MASHSYSLPVGGLVGQTIGIFLRNLVPFLVLGALVLAPWIALRIVFDDAVEKQDNLAIPVLLFLLQSLLAYILTGAVTFGVVQQLRRQPAGFGAVISQGLSSFGRVLGTGLLCGVRILLWTILFYVPGVIESVRLFVAIPAAVMEGKSNVAAVDRSKALTRGSGWSIFGAWLLIAVIGAGIGMIGVFVLHSSDQAVLAKPMWLEITIAVVVGPFSATMAAVAYFMLRRGKENVDATQIAAVFD